MSRMCPLTDRALPDSLAGYQCVTTGLIEDGDLVVQPWPSSPYFTREVGHSIEDYLHGSPSHIYRKIPVANHRDVADEKTKELIAKSEEMKPAWSDLAEPFYAMPTEPAERPKAATHDEGKPPLAYLPWKALREVALVQLYGEQKYHDWFNYKAGMEVGRHASCAMRHIADYMDGIDLDPESKRKHLAHAVCRLLFILENEAEGTAIDDRYRPPERKC